MADRDPANVTALLRRAADGDEASRAAALDLVYDELRSIAGSLFAGERRGHTLQPTVLVHDAYMRLVTSDSAWTDRQHFMVVAARAMRRLLIDHARRYQAEQRASPQQRVAWHEDLVSHSAGFDPVLLSDALTRLEELNPRHAQIVELKFFAGLTNAEVGDVLEVSTRTVETHWPMARAWLLKQIG